MPKLSPDYYIKKMKAELDIKSSTRKRKHSEESISTALKNLEIALKSNTDNFMYEFLNDETNGLEVLLQYLIFKLTMCESSTKTVSSAKKKKVVRKFSKASEEEIILDDVHLSLTCLRAILKNDCGFEIILRHPGAVHTLVLSTYYKNLAAKAVALEILSPISLLREGHSLVLSAFDHCKEINHERHCFESLINSFSNYETFNADFMETCTHFINIIVHTVEDFNFRIYLQYKFTSLGFDEVLESLKKTEDLHLKTQVDGYLKNMIDVNLLVDRLESQRKAMEKMEEQLIRTNEELRLMDTQLKSRNS